MSGSLPPLVESGSALSEAERARYRRHFGLAEIGPQGQSLLKAAKVLVIGAGGLGSPALQYLAAAGVGTIAVVDDDLVEESNLHRQVLHGVDAVGQPKTSSAAAAVQRLNPHLRVIEHQTRLTQGNAEALIAQHHLVLDGSDNFGTRYLVSDAAELAGKPVVWGSLLRFSGQVSVFWAGHGPTLRDVFPKPPTPGSVPSCAEAGVLGSVAGVIGSLMTTEAIKLLLGVGEPLLGRLLIFDGLTAEFRTVPIAVDPNREPVTTLITTTEQSEQPEPTGLSVGDLRALLARRAAGALELTLIDVREPWEFEEGAIDGAINLPEAQVGDLPKELAGRELVLYCQSGARSARALNVLAPRYLNREEQVRHLAGGYDAWVARRGGDE